MGHRPSCRRHYALVASRKEQEIESMECLHCGFPNSDSAKFCANCGTSLTGGQAPVPQSGRLFGHSPLPASRSEGERKLVTVLFADVVNSTSMAESLDPEQVADIMNGAFAFFTDAVTSYGGTVA